MGGGSRSRKYSVSRRTFRCAIKRNAGHYRNRSRKLEKKLLPTDFDYNTINGLRIEAQQKHNEFQPLNIGQASRISGVSPADISVLLVYLEQLKFLNPDLFSKLNTEKSIDGE